MGDKSSVICTLFKIVFLGKWDECGERPLLWPVSQITCRLIEMYNYWTADTTCKNDHVCCLHETQKIIGINANKTEYNLVTHNEIETWTAWLWLWLWSWLWTVLLGPHQDLWLCDLLSDGWQEQPLNEVVEALAPNILIQLFSPLYHSIGPHNTFSTRLRFVQLQSIFCQSLTGYIADVAGTFDSYMIWLSGRAAWNFLLSSLFPVPRTCLPVAVDCCESLIRDLLWLPHPVQPPMPQTRLL